MRPDEHPTGEVTDIMRVLEAEVVDVAAHGTSRLLLIESRAGEVLHGKGYVSYASGMTGTVLAGHLAFLSAPDTAPKGEARPATQGVRCFSSDGGSRCSEMSDSPVVGEMGGSVTAETVSELAASFRGAVMAPSDPGYDDARQIWNGMIDRRPGLIARCADADDVVTAVNVARRHGVLLSVRGGDHSAAGNAVCDGGLMVDLSAMKDVIVDPGARVARAGPGARWVDFDRETQRHGLATTGGTVSDTGVAGLTVGGGLGWLAGKYGLTCDNLLGADVVTADGRLVRASPTEHEDLFWALRGGSGNFGVVTAFEFQVHPVGPTVQAGMVVHPVDRAVDVLRFYRDFTESMADEINTIAGFLTTPDGLPVVAVAACHCGSAEEGERALRPLKSFGPPLLDQIGAVPYTAFQQALDPNFPRGRRYYWKSTLIRELSEGAIEKMAELFTKVSSPLSFLLLQQLGNAANRVPGDATAFAHRDARWDGLLLTSWEDSVEDTKHVTWTRDAWTALRPFATGGVYVNGVADGDTEEISGAYGANYGRLASIKAMYDPTNLFRMNANIAPTPGAVGVP